MKKYKWGRKRYKLQFEEKKSIRKFNVQLRLLLKEMERLRRSLIFNVIKGKVTLRQNLRQLSFQLVKGKGLKNPLLLERNNKSARDSTEPGSISSGQANLSLLSTW